MAGRRSQILPSPGHSHAHHRRAQPIKDPPKEEHRDRMAARGIQITDSGEWTPCLGFSQGCPKKASVLVSRCGTHTNESTEATLWSIFQEGCSLGVWGPLWDAGKEHLRLHKTYYGMFRGGI